MNVNSDVDFRGPGSGRDRSGGRTTGLWEPIILLKRPGRPARVYTHSRFSLRSLRRRHKLSHRLHNIVFRVCFLRVRTIFTYIYIPTFRVRIIIIIIFFFNKPNKINNKIMFDREGHARNVTCY